MTLGSLIGEIQGGSIKSPSTGAATDSKSKRGLPAMASTPSRARFRHLVQTRFIEIKTDGEVIGIIGVEAIEALLEPPIHRPGDQNGISEGYRVLFDILERMVFSAMSRRELLAVSREIEDRAFRVGEGTLWVGFQTLSAFKSQVDVYRTLSDETNLNIHIYGVEDWTPPEISEISYHTEEATRFEPYWVLAYDGGPDENQACGLVAKEYSDEYTGFWTNDPTTVEDIATTFNTV